MMTLRVGGGIQLVLVREEDGITGIADIAVLPISKIYKPELYDGIGFTTWDI